MFQVQFTEAFDKRRVHEAAQWCRSEEATKAENRSRHVRAGGVLSSGQCLLATAGLVSVGWVPLLEGRELEPGTGPFNSASCKNAVSPGEAASYAESRGEVEPLCRPVLLAVDHLLPRSTHLALASVSVVSVLGGHEPGATVGVGRGSA